MSATTRNSMPKSTENPNPVYVSETVAGTVARTVAGDVAPERVREAIQARELQQYSALITRTKVRWRAVQFLMIVLMFVAAEFLVSAWFANFGASLGWKIFVGVLGLAIGGYAAFHSYLLTDRKSMPKSIEKHP